MLNELFKQALCDSVALLQELPRRRALVEDSRERFQRFRGSHPGVHCDLLVDQPPASDAVDYDILLSGAAGPNDGGTIAVTWRPDQRLPWTVQYSDHWAANQVLSVNDLDTSIQSALIYLDTVLDRKPSLREDLIDKLLINEALAESPPPVTKPEIEKAVNAFRTSRGLFSAADTRLWLEKMSLTMEALRDQVAHVVRAGKLKTRLTRSRARPYFDAHRDDFDLVTFFRLWAPSKVTAAKVGKAARRSGLSPLPPFNGELATVFARALPTPFAGASLKAIVGPERSAQGYWVGQLLQRTSARFDSRTQKAIEDLLFQEWLAERRKQAKVRWHWV